MEKATGLAKLMVFIIVIAWFLLGLFIFLSDKVVLLLWPVRVVVIVVI